MIKIEVKRKSDGELIAEDCGESISIQTLKAKMLKKGIDIESSDYQITQEDLTEEDLKSEKQKIKEKLKDLDTTKLNTIAQIKPILKDIIDLLKEN